MENPDGLRMKTAAGRWVLLTTVLGSAIVMIDGTVVNVALPHIGADLDAGHPTARETAAMFERTDLLPPSRPADP